MEHGSSLSSEAARWEYFKTVILDLYITQEKPLAEVALSMRNEYGFTAFENSYKYYLGKWGINKNMSSTVKEAAIAALGKRIRDGNSTPPINYNDQPINKKRLIRHINTAEKKREKKDNTIPLGTNVFTVWNLPYRAFRSASAAVDHFSPFPATPAYIRVVAVSPRNQASPNNAPTPTTLAIRSVKFNERARLLIQAKHDDLLKHMENPEKVVLTTYLYQFWLFAFKTAKHWGHGPLDWTSDLLEFERFKDKDRTYSSPNTPGFAATPGSDTSIGYHGSLTNQPSALCKWTIHAAIRNEFEVCDDCVREEDEPLSPGLDVEESWSRWPASKTRQTFEGKLQAALENNTFSNFKLGDLPIEVAQITKATRRSPKELLQESFGFSIVARNEEVFWKILPEVANISLDDTGIYPLHLLTSFLDGSRTCCNLLNAAISELAEESSIKKIYINDHGHTVLDNLMISILKNHTGCQPHTVDDKFVKTKRFTGEEVNICGRWDADSACVRELFAAGHSTIPFEWKHMFCHTSTQAIVHCIGRLFRPVFALDINTPSGLFLKYCQACGAKLQLLPLHCLVLTTVHVARSGCPGENLFGMLACLVCLLANGANPHSKTPLSLLALRNKDSATECSHENLDPFELAERVPESLISGLTEEATLGWKLFCSMLKYARDERRGQNLKPSTKGKEREEDFRVFLEISDDEISDKDMEVDTDEDDYESEANEELCKHAKYTSNCYSGSKVIGTLWAAIQTELVTYRRIGEGDPWISPNFDMGCLLDDLNSGSGLINIPLVANNMMNPFCQCGRFDDVADEACACVDEVCVEYFANVDVWDRARYITIPQGGCGFWYDF